MKWLSLGSVLVLGALLAGCRAESVELTVSYEDVAAAIKGEKVTVPFEAVFSQFGNLGDDQKAEIDALATVVSKHMNVEDFEIGTAENKVVVTVEGEIPITTSETESSPYYVLVTKDGTFNGFATVQVALGRKFQAMQREMRAINFILAPEAFHPTKLKIKAKGKDIMAPAVEVDGTTHLLFSAQAKERLTLNYVGGPYERVGAGFYIKVD